MSMRRTAPWSIATRTRSACSTPPGKLLFVSASATGPAAVQPSVQRRGRAIRRLTWPTAMAPWCTISRHGGICAPGASRAMGRASSPRHGASGMPDVRVLVGDRENDASRCSARRDWLCDWPGTPGTDVDLCRRARRRVATDHIPRMVAYSSAGADLGGCRPVLRLAHGVTGDARTISISEMNPNRYAADARSGCSFGTRVLAVPAHHGARLRGAPLDLRVELLGRQAARHRELHALSRRRILSRRDRKIRADRRGRHW